MLGPERPTLAQAVFDRAAHRRTDPAWLARAWPTARVLLISPRSSTPVRHVDGEVHVVFADAAELPADSAAWFLGLAAGVAYFALLTEQTEDSWETLRDIALIGDALELDLLVTAVALAHWHGRHTHCPMCGTRTSVDQAGWTRRCPVDGSQHFPRTDPAVIMLVHDGGDRCLLGRSVSWPAGRFSTLAGFVEPGESLEAAVVREVFEEVAVTVGDVRYVASQPWPFPSSLMLGFSARGDGELAATPDRVEIAEAAWFTREQVQWAADWSDANAEADHSVVLGAISPRLSISRYLIDEWLARRLGT